jgi:methylglutaconyl-CoA hydratase
MEDSEKVLLRQQGSVLTVVLNNPEQHNALSVPIVASITSAFRNIRHRSDVRVVVLTGNGRSFCAGADLSTVKNVASHGFDLNLVDGQAIFDLMMAIDGCPCPVIGRVNGAAIGGGVGLISCCDIVVSVDRANFGFSEVRLGLVPAVISPFVVAKIGVGRARELFLTGERFTAGYALEIGLVQHVVPEDELDEKVNERVKQLLMAAPGAQTDAKKLVKAVSHRPKEDVRGYTTDLFARRWNSEEGREGIRSYLDKRKPGWQS